MTLTTAAAPLAPRLLRKNLRLTNPRISVQSVLYLHSPRQNNLVSPGLGMRICSGRAPGLRGKPPKYLAQVLLTQALAPGNDGQSLNFEPPIQITELTGPLSFYHMYDGTHSVADGSWWFERRLIDKALQIAKRHPGFAIYDRQAYTLKLLRSAMCVHPEWTNYSDIAGLALASGRSVPAIKGRASHRALWQELGRHVDPTHPLARK